MDARDVFTNIYETDEWKGGSGEGSTVAATAPYRRILEHVLASPDVRSVTDVGCGDWQFSGLVDWQGKAYVGIDVVPTSDEEKKITLDRFSGRLRQGSLPVTRRTF